MSVPENQVYIDGQGQLDADGLNTFVQLARTMSDLRAFTGISNMQVAVLGQNAVNDGGGGSFYWNAGSTANDDNGITTVVPSGSTQGAWSRLIASEATGYNFTNAPADPTGTTSATGVMMGAITTFAPAKSGKYLLIFNGQALNTTSPDGSQIELRYGTGTPPSNGAALEGTVIANANAIITTAANNQRTGFSIATYLTGLTVGTTYWLDLSLAATGGGTASLAALGITGIEQ
jgi:hypothetical protein